MIRICDLTIVGMVTILGTKWFGWIVRAVRIVEMQPQEKRAMRRFLQPMQGMTDTLSSPAVHESKVLVLKGGGGKGVVVVVETAGQAPTAVEHEGTYYCSGRVTSLLESLCQRAKLRRERVAGEVLHTVLKRIRSRQNGRVRRPGQRDLRERSLK